MADLSKLATELFNEIRDWIRPALEGIGKRLDSLESKAADLDTRQQRTLADHFRGPHSRGVQYSRGDLVLKSGATYLVLKDQPEGGPGDSSDFLLIAKGGSQ